MVFRISTAGRQASPSDKIKHTLYNKKAGAAFLLSRPADFFGLRPASGRGTGGGTRVKPAAREEPGRTVDFAKKLIRRWKKEITDVYLQSSKDVDVVQLNIHKQ